MAAPDTNTFTVDGTYNVDLRNDEAAKGERSYFVSAGGTFGGGTLTFLFVDTDSNTFPVEDASGAIAITSAKVFRIDIPDALTGELTLRATLAGSTSPDLDYKVYAEAFDA